MNKVDLIRSQIGIDWSKEIVEGASMDDLDSEVVKRARELFSKRQSDRKKAQEMEFEDRLVFINEGDFIPETIEQALEPGYKPPYYRNVFLCNAMVNLYMIDSNSMGIPMMYQIQRDKSFPLPTYDLNTINRVKVTVYGKILDKNYTQLLYSSGDLDMRTVFLLVQVQKHEVVSKESFKQLKKRGLVKVSGDSAPQSRAIRLMYNLLEIQSGENRPCVLL